MLFCDSSLASMPLEVMLVYPEAQLSHPAYLTLKERRFRRPFGSPRISESAVAQKRGGG